MRKETKENIQYSTAVGMLVLGASLAVAGFVCSEPMGQIHDSVLWLFAQCLLYAGSVFGISIYINSRFNNLIEKLKEGDTTVFVLQTLLQDGPHRQRTIQGLTSDGYVRICRYLQYMFRTLRIKIRCALWLLLYLMLRMVFLP